MEIIIDNVLKVGADFRVSFRSQCGRGEALWVGPMPKAGDVRVVELDVGAPVAVGSEVLESDAAIGMDVQNGATVLVGSVIEADDGYVRLNLGCGSVNLANTGRPAMVGLRYSLRAPLLKVFDCEY